MRVIALKSGFVRAVVNAPWNLPAPVPYALERETPRPRPCGTQRPTRPRGAPSVLQVPILALLREYSETGLTVGDLADELGAHGGQVQQVLLTLASQGLVMVAGRVPGSGKPALQWKLRGRST